MGIKNTDNTFSFTCDGKTLSFTIDGFTNKNNTDYTVDIDDSIAKSLGLDLTVDGVVAFFTTTPSPIKGSASHAMAPIIINIPNTNNKPSKTMFSLISSFLLFLY